jgi:hypothetical protein
MLSASTIIAWAHGQGRVAKEEQLEPRQFDSLYDIRQNYRAIPNIGAYRPDGWELIEHEMVDATGLGADWEPALTANQFHTWVCNEWRKNPEVGFAIIEVGQFQVVVGKFYPVDGALGNADDFQTYDEWYVQLAPECMTVVPDEELYRYWREGDDPDDIDPNDWK